MKLFDAKTKHGTSLAIFDYSLMYDSVVIFDLHDENNCSRSVTNDVENVIEIINIGLQGIGDRKVIYRDTNRIWDEIIIKNNQFHDFKPLNKKTLTEALEVIHGKS